MNDRPLIRNVSESKLPYASQKLRVLSLLFTSLFLLASFCSFYEEVTRFMTVFQTARSAAAVSCTPEAAMS